jgi:hypothetical protein
MKKITSIALAARGAASRRLAGLVLFSAGWLLFMQDMARWLQSP